LWNESIIQSEDVSILTHPQKKHQELSTLFSYNQEQLYGFIGDNYQRFILHYDTIYKESDQNKYHAEGYVIYRKDSIKVESSNST
jgi:hypothetical protein